MNKEEQDEQITKAKEIIEELIDSLILIDGEQIKELRAVKLAEQFLMDSSEPSTL